MEVSQSRFKMNNISIQIAVKDRPTELFGLLQSLRTQTYQKFNVLILDDGSGTVLHNHYFLNHMISRLRFEGHDVKVIRNEIPSGVSKARQQLVDYSLKNGKEEYFLRLDDDVMIEPNYLELLLKVIDEGYDIASGITTPFANPDMKRDVKFVEPVIGDCRLLQSGELYINFDDCGHNYLQSKILPSCHFRSCALIKKKVFENGVNYNSRLSKNGFREEQILSFKALIKGFKIGVHTGANARHLMTPSGGERDTMNMTDFNQKIFEETTKKMYEEHGNFIEDYYKRLKIEPKVYTKEELKKETNLVSNK